MYNTQYSNNSAVLMQNRSTVKAFLRKPIILIFAIINLCGLGISVLNFIINMPTLKAINESASNDLNKIFNSNYYAASTASSYTDATFIINAVLTAAIGLLFVLPMFMIFFKSLNKNHESKPSASLTILKVLSIIGVVLMSICLVAVAASSIILIAAFISSGVTNRESIDLFTGNGVTISITGESLLIGLVVLLAALILVVTITLIWVISQLRFISSLKRGINTAKPLKSSGALPIAVLSVIFAIFAALSLFSTLTLKSSLEASSSEILFNALMPNTYYVLLSNINFSSTYYIFMVASAVVSLLTYILSFIIAVMYRKHIKRANSNPAPAYTSYQNQSGNGGYYGDSYSSNDKVSAPTANYNNTYSQPVNPYNSYTSTYNQPNNYSQPKGTYSTSPNNYYAPQPEAPAANTSTAYTEPATAPVENTTTESADSAYSSDSAEKAVNEIFGDTNNNSADSTPTTYYCENCGKPYTDGDAFCENCGSKLN